MFVDTPGVHQADAPAERADGGHRARGDARGRRVAGRRRASGRGGGDRFLLDVSKEVKAPVSWRSTRSTSWPSRSCCRSSIATPRASVRRDRAGLGARRRQRRAARAAVPPHLPEGEPLYPEDYLTDQPERFFVAEIVREQVLQHTHDELPFSTAVVVDRSRSRTRTGLMRLYCTILVERESQKPIVVGKGGAMIKAIGTRRARSSNASSTRACSSTCTSR